MSLGQVPRAPGRGPLVLPLLLGIFTLQALCLPALPVLFVAGGIIRWRGWRPGLVALAAAVVLTCEIALFGPALAVLHFSGWAQFSVAHPFGVLVPRLVVESPIGVPLGILLGALVVAHGEHHAAGADWHPATRRKRARERARVGRQASRQLARHTEDPALPQLGVLLADLGLSAWIAGRYVIVPPELRGLGQVVIGMPGMGKTVTLLRLVYLAAKQGRQVVFLDCKGTDPRLPGLVAAAYRMANPHARVRVWPGEPFDLWRGSPAEITNKLLGTQVFAAEGGGVWYADLAARATQLAVEAPTSPPRSSGEFMARLHVKALKALWEQASDPATAQAALLDIDAFHDHELRGVRLKFATFFHSLRGRFDGTWAWEDCDLAVCTVPAIAKRDADAVVRALIEDLRYYLLDPARKPDRRRVLRRPRRHHPNDRPGRTRPRRRRPMHPGRPDRPRAWHRGAARPAARRLHRRHLPVPHARPRAVPRPCRHHPGAGVRLAAGPVGRNRAGEDVHGRAAPDRPEPRPPSPTPARLRAPSWPGRQLPGPVRPRRARPRPARHDRSGGDRHRRRPGLGA